MKAKTASGWETEWKKRVPALVVSSGFLIGSHTVPSEEVDRTFAMPIGKLRKRAGIETIAYASDGENELRSEEHTSELQSHSELVCRLLLEKKKPKLSG